MIERCIFFIDPPHTKFKQKPSKVSFLSEHWESNPRMFEGGVRSKGPLTQEAVDLSLPGRKTIFFGKERSATPCRGGQGKENEEAWVHRKIWSISPGGGK